LILEGANPETHEDAVTLLGLRLVKPGLLPYERRAFLDNSG